MPKTTAEAKPENQKSGLWTSSVRYRSRLTALGGVAHISTSQEIHTIENTIKLNAPTIPLLRKGFMVFTPIGHKFSPFSLKRLGVN